MAVLEPYVALLRGINVGGKNIIPMRALAETFERLKLASVRTYIQSGNVLFQAAGSDARALEERIERALKRAHACEAKVVVRSAEEMARITEGLPRSWKRPEPDARYNVVFLRHEIDAPSIVDDLKPKPGLEEVSYRPGVLYWFARAKDLSRTAMVKLSSHRIYPFVTVRNLNTTKKLAELVAELEPAG